MELAFHVSIAARPGHHMSARDGSGTRLLPAIGFDRKYPETASRSRLRERDRQATLPYRGKLAPDRKPVSSANRVNKVELLSA
jgi:hypothetical protein